MRKALLPFLEDKGISRDLDEKHEFAATLEGASDFDLELISGSSLYDLESESILPLIQELTGVSKVNDRDLLQFLLRRGLAYIAWFDKEKTSRSSGYRLSSEPMVKLKFFPPNISC